MRNLLRHLGTFAIVAALVFALGASSVWFLQGSRSFQSCIGDNQKEAGNNGKPSEKRASILNAVSVYRDCVGRFVVEHDPALTALGTLAVAIFTIVLAAVTARQINLARDEFLATHRPKVIVHSFEATHDNNGAIGASFTLVNTGVSAARITDISAMIVLSRDLRPGIQMPRKELNKTLVSGEPWIWAVFGDLTASIIVEKFNKPTDVPLWCMGRITYADQRGRKRETGFCRMYDVRGERWIKSPESDYEYAY